MNYSKKDINVVDIPNPYTGEFEPHKLEKIEERKLTMKQGWQMVYIKNRDEMILRLGSEKRLSIFFHIEYLFDKKSKVVVINQTEVAKAVGVSRQYVSAVMKLMIEADYIRNVGSGGQYKVNPFYIVPMYQNGIELQKEWAEETNIYKGGLPAEEIDKYRFYLHTETWKIKAERCKKNAGYRCSNCGTIKGLEAHHLTYDNLYKEKVDDLQCLCSVCHKEVHKD